MSERNVEVVRSLLGPFQGINVAEIDWGAEPIRQLLAGSCSPDIEVRTLESGMGAGVDPVYNGVDGVVSYLRAWMSATVAPARAAECRSSWSSSTPARCGTG